MIFNVFQSLLLYLVTCRDPLTAATSIHRTDPCSVELTGSTGPTINVVAKMRRQAEGEQLQKGDKRKNWLTWKIKSRNEGRDKQEERVWKSSSGTRMRRKNGRGIENS